MVFRFSGGKKVYCLRNENKEGRATPAAENEAEHERAERNVRRNPVAAEMVSGIRKDEARRYDETTRPQTIGRKHRRHESGWVQGVTASHTWTRRAGRGSPPVSASVQLAGREGEFSVTGLAVTGRARRETRMRFSQVVRTAAGR